MSGKFGTSTDEQFAFQNRLRESFARARGRNPSFSLRAFARQLQLSPSAVSEILAGRRRVSRKLAARVLDRLRLNPTERARLLAPFAKATPSPEAPGVDYLELSSQHYQLLSEWQHFAILSLAETHDFDPAPERVAARLGITVSKARRALLRLTELGLLERSPAGKLKPTGRALSSSDEVASLAVRSAHYQNLELARASLDQDPIDRRDFVAITMAINPAKIPEAKKRIRKFSDSLCQELEVTPQEEVYKLCIQLVPLSRRPAKKGEKA